MTARFKKVILLLLPLAALSGCAGTLDVYRDANMDFGAIKTVAVVPFSNLTRESVAADRVRDVFASMLLATGAIYVVPQGEVQRVIGKASPSGSSSSCPTFCSSGLKT